MNHEGLLCRRDAMSAAQHGRWSALVTSCLAVAIVAAGSAQQDVRLVSAVKAQNTALIQQLLSEGVDVNAARVDGVTALLSGRRIGTTTRPLNCCWRSAPTRTPQRTRE